MLLVCLHVRCKPQFQAFTTTAKAAQQTSRRCHIASQCLSMILTPLFRCSQGPDSTNTCSVCVSAEVHPCVPSGPNSVGFSSHRGAKPVTATSHAVAARAGLEAAADRQAATCFCEDKRREGDSCCDCHCCSALMNYLFRNICAEKGLGL